MGDEKKTHREIDIVAMWGFDWDQCPVEIKAEHYLLQISHHSLRDHSSELIYLEQLRTKVERLAQENLQLEADHKELLKDMPEVERRVKELERVVLAGHSAVDALCYSLAMGDESGYVIEGANKRREKALLKYRKLYNEFFFPALDKLKGTE